MKILKGLADEELVKHYALGNNKAFEVLLSRYKSRVYSYIYFIVRNRELTEDIFQDTFVKAIVTIKQGRYFESGKFLAWINRIAHNLIIDHFRHERNENTVSNEDSEIDLFNNAKLCEDCIEDSIVQEQIMNDVIKLVDYLPDNQRDVIRMRYYDDLSFKEIADKTGVSINTALGRMRYALLNMRRIADEKDVCLNVS